MKHLDLFSGIGGFSLAGRRVWGSQYQNIGFCEINKYCQAVLKKNFGKDIRIYEDIKKLKADGQKVDILTGGFPCQPFSCAGKKRGHKDERYLWHEMFRVISEFRPRWIIGENVGGIVTMAQFDDASKVGSETDLFGNRIDTHSRRGRGILFGILEQLGEIGYSVQTFLIPALAVGCCHRRNRVWIVASDTRCEYGARSKKQREYATADRKRNAPQSERSVVSDRTGSVTDSKHIRCDESKVGESGFVGSDREPTGKEEILQSSGSNLSRTNSSNTSEQGSQGWMPEGSGYRGLSCGAWNNERANWRKNWFEVATAFCRVDDGLSVELDGLKLSKSAHRVERLKALGNAIVPQVAEEIMLAIREVDRENNK